MTVVSTLSNNTIILQCKAAVGAKSELMMHLMSPISYQAHQSRYSIGLHLHSKCCNLLVEYIWIQSMGPACYTQTLFAMKGQVFAVTCPVHCIDNILTLFFMSQTGIYGHKAYSLDFELQATGDAELCLTTTGSPPQDRVYIVCEDIKKWKCCPSVKLIDYKINMTTSGLHYQRCLEQF